MVFKIEQNLYWTRKLVYPIVIETSANQERDSTTLLMRNSSSRPTPAYHTLSHLTDTMRRLTIVRSRTVRLALNNSKAPWLMLKTATKPQCPKGIMQWQHGTWTKFQNGSLYLEPIRVDGRQLLSDPCSYKTSIYTRYNQSELFQVCNSLVELLRALSRHFIALRGVHRSLSQHHAPEPLQIRRLPSNAALSCIQPSSNASHTDP